MTINRAAFTALQRQWTLDAFSFTGGEDAQRARFDALAADTFDALAVAGAGGEIWVPVYSIRPWSAWGWLGQAREHHPMPPALAERWQAWASDYPALLFRNPKLELRDLLQDCSETHTASSFPSGWEDIVYAWVAGDQPASARPFDDRTGIIDDRFLSDLRRLLGDIGGGWLMWSNTARCVVYVPADEWHAVCERRAAERADRRRQIEERASRDPALATMIAEARRRSGR